MRDAGYGMHVAWVLCETPDEAEVVRRCGLWLPCDCTVSRLGFFHWVRSDGPAVGLGVTELGRELPWRTLFLQNAAGCVLTGYGHALSPSLAVGDVLMATAVFEGSAPETLETGWPAPVPGIELGVGVVAAPVLVTDRVPETPHRRQALYRQTGAWAVRRGSPRWLEGLRSPGGVGLLLWVMDTAQERTSPDDPDWRLRRHRAILERHGDRIEWAVRRLLRVRGTPDGVRQKP